MKLSRNQFLFFRIFVIVWLTLGIIFSLMFYKGSLAWTDFALYMGVLGISAIIIIAVLLFYKFKK
jgi:hypothetical protein